MDKDDKWRAVRKVEERREKEARREERVDGRVERGKEKCVRWGGERKKC